MTDFGANRKELVSTLLGNMTSSTIDRSAHSSRESWFYKFLLLE